ncbi:MULTISPECIES: class I SAM-dependent methyltransferase [Thermomonosporaceae]|uniref:class I SAM-dependent methyltransferase n=1 Tax=Thermomonosporaceae TaxID=2012 RepID=UPI00255ADB72|nr:MULTISPECIES: class I SAM-dependent methyltransferase [Thermomonosporaceae]MDL4773554.1 class I SAM-dependent methyltransferase [Actinomadura xylanilytica]
MSLSHTSGFSPDWLALRENADAAARAPELVTLLKEHLPAGRLVIRDLGCGTGSMGRWLAPQLPGPQHWILHDHDPALLVRATTGMTGMAASDGSRVTVETHQGDLAGLSAADLTGTSLITGSALLDLLTATEVDQLAMASTGAGIPALLTLSVDGRVALSPDDPLDAEYTAAFNAHQRRTHHGRRLLGPDAAATAALAFERHGAAVRTRPSPWRLDAAQAQLTAEWLRGWAGAAREQRPELANDSYLPRRLGTCTAGELHVTIEHTDLLALPERPA